ncbi:unnamed protein product, partial [Sphacelaria rigidula]
CGKAGQWQQALRLVAELEALASESLKPDTILYNIAIDAVRRMKRWGARPNKSSYHSLIDACSKAGKWELTLFYLKQMLHAGIPANTLAFGLTIHACARHGEWKTVLQLL